MYAGTDPLTRRPIRLRATARTETQARIELGKLLEKARDGRSPEADVTMAKLLDEYAPIARWDVSTRQTNEGFIRRPLKPAIGQRSSKTTYASSRTLRSDQYFSCSSPHRRQMRILSPAELYCQSPQECRSLVSELNSLSSQRTQI